ncbi:acyltransferase [Bradyrhizobium sp. 21]|uniref:acyltransferase family protein n=1 Tax=Bradyrhizobium sp. 21 TaxID=2782666 RepID=UPI001FFA289B|nr:acyltransferase [Bradyrhizobium sp. 21]MCK1384511.1 acyltransferase [Bradyrhizobium sp. 21]
MTLREQLDRYKGQGPGFDAARLVLSISILCWHSVVTSYGHAAETKIWNGLFSAPLSALMPMFFALSGFLVMGSFERSNNLRGFLGLRALRIVPALSVEILISALMLGSLLTTLPLASYYSDPKFFRYFGSLFGFVNYTLPGVFADNPDPDRVNLSLWTIAPELMCYVYLGLLMALRLKRTGVTISAIVLLVICLAADSQSGVDRADTGVVFARFLLMSFAFGNLIYLWREYIPFRWDLLVVSIVVGCLFIKTPVLIYLSLLCLAYVIVFVGCVPIFVPKPFSTGDYSYGIYLYAYPIQQTYAHFFTEHREFYWNILFCLPATCLVAAISWWFIEKPALSWRKSLYKLPVAATELTFVQMAVPFVLLAVYGVLLFVTSGLFETGVRLRSMFPWVVVCALVVVGFRVMFLRFSGRPKYQQSFD